MRAEEVGAHRHSGQKWNVGGCTKRDMQMQKMGLVRLQLVVETGRHQQYRSRISNAGGLRKRKIRQER